MNSEQQKQMRTEFEEWAVTMPVDKWHIGADNIRKNQSNNYIDPKAFYAWKGFQAAYTPRPDLEVVVASLVRYYKERIKREFPNATCVPSDYHHGQEARPLAEYLVDAIFNKGNDAK